MSNFELKVSPVWGGLKPIVEFENPHGFFLDAFPAGSFAGVLEPCDNGIVVLNSKGELFVNFDTRWFKAPWLVPTTGAVEFALASIKSDPEAYLNDPDYDTKSEDEDWADDEMEKVMSSFGWFGWQPAEPG